MLPFGHLSASYILAETPSLFGQPLTPLETGLIILAGNAPDIDSLFIRFRKKSFGEHRISLTHTPFGVTFLWAIWMVAFGNRFSPIVDDTILAALYLHLFLDNTPYWLSLLGLRDKTIHRIHWSYPFRPSGIKHKPRSLPNSISHYFSREKTSAIVEVLLATIALYLLYAHFLS